jgi:hypothetical protein
VNVGHRYLDTLMETQLRQLLDELAGDPRARRLGWRVHEAPLRRGERFAARNEVIRQQQRDGRSYRWLAWHWHLSLSTLHRICKKNRSSGGGPNGKPRLE